LRPHLSGAGGQHRRRHGREVQPAPAGERHRQLREGGPARADQDRLRQGTGPPASPAPRHVRDADRPHAVSAESPSPSVPHVNPWIIATSVMFATFMEILDTTVVNVSLPHIAGTLSASTDAATCAPTSYPL